MLGRLTSSSRVKTASKSVLMDQFMPCTSFTCACAPPDQPPCWHACRRLPTHCIHDGWPYPCVVHEFATAAVLHAWKRPQPARMRWQGQTRNGRERAFSTRVVPCTRCSSGLLEKVQMRRLNGGAVTSAVSSDSAMATYTGACVMTPQFSLLTIGRYMQRKGCMTQSCRQAAPAQSMADSLLWPGDMHARLHSWCLSYVHLCQL